MTKDEHDTRDLADGGVMTSTEWQVDHAYADGWDDGMREGERRMLWAIAVGAEWDCVRCEDEAAEEWASAHSEAMQIDAAASSGAAWGFAAMRKSALHALRDLGDEDAARVLGERGW